MSLSDALSLLPDIHIHASLVLCALVLAWMVAIHRRADAQTPTRRTRRKTMQSTHQTGSATSSGDAVSSVPSTGPRRSIVSLARTARPSLGSTAVSAGSFTIRWDRTAIALVVVLGLLTALITVIAALFGAPTLAATGISLAVAALGVAGLRLLALRDRKRRTDRQIEAAFEAASSPVAAGSVFDAAASAAWAVHGQQESTQVERSEQAEQPSVEHTAAQTSSASAAVSTATAASERSVQAPAARTETSGSAGQLTVPRPTYLDAPEAIRPEQKPLELPQVQLAQPGTRLKDGVSAEYAARVQSTANRSLDLDKVLERRRAG